MIVFTRSKKDRTAAGARIRSWGIVCSLCAIAILAGWLAYARISRSADFIEERLNYKLLEDTRWQDIVWTACDPLKKDAKLAVTWTGADTSLRLCISLVHGTEGIIQVFPADRALEGKAIPLAVYRYHERRLIANQCSLSPEDRLSVQKATVALCDFLRMSL